MIEYDQSPTTASTRKWCVADFERIQALLVHPGTRLPPELLALAQQLGGPTALAWPNWLIVGISLKYLLRELEAQLAPAPEDESRRGMRPRREATPVEPVESERVTALREELTKTTNKKARAAIEKQLKDLGAL